ncbi:MAG: metallophosphoesterase [Cyanobacteria bacterium J06558_2]
MLSWILSCVPIAEQKFATSNDSPQTAKNIPSNIYLPPQEDLRIAVISDLNSQYGATEYESEVHQAIALMEQLEPDLVLCGGDMIAGQKLSLTRQQIQSMWKAFEEQIAAPLREAQLPFGFTIGNHDGSGAIKNKSLVFQQERDLAQAYWLKHREQLGLNLIDSAHFPFYYTFQQQGIFFLVWDASTHQISDEQLAWVKQSLSSKVAKRAKSIIVLGHLPLYPVAPAKDKPGEYLANSNQLRSLLEQNQVLIYVSGHHHAYYPGKINGLKLLHAGALGQGERALINSDLPPQKTVTLIDLKLATSEIVYTTYNAKTWKVISLKQLPTSIPYLDGEIKRHDL